MEGPIFPAEYPSRPRSVGIKEITTTGPPPSRSRSTGRSVGDARARRRTTGDPRPSRNCSSCGRRRIRPSNRGSAFVSQTRPPHGPAIARRERGGTFTVALPPPVREREEVLAQPHEPQGPVQRGAHHHRGEHHGGDAAAAAPQGAPSTPATARPSAGRWGGELVALGLRPIRQADRDVRGPGGRARLALPVVSAFQKR